MKKNWFRQMLVLWAMVMFSGLTMPSLFAQSRVTKNLELTYSIIGQPCKGRQIQFHTELKNVGEKVVYIDDRFLKRYESDFYFPHDGDPMSRPRVQTAMGDSFSSRRVPEAFVKRIAPGRSIGSNHFVDPGRNRFFAEAGDYRVDTGYGQFLSHSEKGKRMFVGGVESSPLLFKIRDCTARD